MGRAPKGNEKVFQPSIFRGVNVSFRECNPIIPRKKIGLELPKQLQVHRPCATGMIWEYGSPSPIGLMAEILHKLIGSLSHYLQGKVFIHPRWCRISSINSMTRQIFSPRNWGWVYVGVSPGFFSPNTSKEVQVDPTLSLCLEGHPRTGVCS